MLRSGCLFAALTILFSVIILIEPLHAQSWTEQLREGDIIFQISRSAQSQAIQLATGSRYSHVGILLKEGKADTSRWVVFEAVQPVRFVDLSIWIKNGERSHFVVKRYAESDRLGRDEIQRMRKQASQWVGRNYDSQFRWTDDRLYCSELVWKLYALVDIETVPLRRFSDYDLKHPVVQRKMRERYGQFPPLHEQAVSPGDLFDSDRFRTVIDR